jgi:predicted aminopeptidase
VGRQWPLRWLDQCTALNNAKVLPFGLYEQWLPAFAVLFKRVGGDWPRFFQRASLRVLQTQL